MPSTAATTRVQERMLLCLLLRENYRQSVEQRRCRATIFYAISIKSARARCHRANGIKGGPNYVFLIT